MTEKDFKNVIKNGLSGGYLLYGDEEFLCGHYIKEAVRSVIGEDDEFFAINLIECDENRFSVSALADALSTFPMMSDKVCVVFRCRLSSLKEKDKAELEQTLSALSDYPAAVLLLVACKGYFDAGQVKKNKPSSLYKMLTKYLAPVEFAYQPPAVLKKWVSRHFERDGVTCSDALLERIVEISGPDMTALSNEIEKLSCYALSSGENEVTAQTVEMLCSEYGELDAFALSNAIVSGDRAAALDALRERRDKKQHPTAVLAGVISDFTNMLSVSIYMNSGLYKDDIAKKTGLHPYRVAKYMDAVRSSETERLRAALERCREADRLTKTSNAGYMALERLICTMPSSRSRGAGSGR